MRPSKSELIALLGRVLGETVGAPTEFQSETALAGRLGVDARRLRALREAGVVAPRRLGRGFVYGAEEARVSAVAARLGDFGLSVGEIGAFLDGPCDPADCRRGGTGCRPHDCSAALLTRLADRVEARIAELRGFQWLLEQRPE